MGRPSLHPASALIDAAQGLAAAASTEAVTIAAVARAAGAPVGSIYHRFSSRDELLAAAWLDAQVAFQAGFVKALRDAGTTPGLAAARQVVEWSRQEPVRARLLVLHQARDFRSSAWGEEDRERSRALATELEAALSDFCDRHLGGRGGAHRRLATFALLDLPYASVRRYLAAGFPPPPEVDGYLEVALAALLPAGTKLDPPAF